MSETEERINVCETCSTPLIATMMIIQNEIYCPGCGKSYPFGAGRSVAWTPELYKIESDNYERFHEIYDNMVPPGCQIEDCDKCKNSHEYHRSHWTDEEKAKDAQGQKDLKTMLLPGYRR